MVGLYYLATNLIRFCCLLLVGSGGCIRWRGKKGSGNGVYGRGRERVCRKGVSGKEDNRREKKKSYERRKRLKLEYLNIYIGRNIKKGEVRGKDKLDMREE